MGVLWRPYTKGFTHGQVASAGFARKMPEAKGKRPEKKVWRKARRRFSWASD